jgi:spermidine synthase
VTLLFAVGALSMLAQIVVLRELVAALYGVELLYVLALGAWLVGTSIGSAAGRRVRATAWTGSAGCVALGLLVPLEVMVVRIAGPAVGAVPGAYLPFPLQLAWVAAATMLPAAICGLLFPPLAGLVAARGRSLGRSYAIESAGAAAAGAAVTAAMALGASTWQVAVVMPGAGIAAAILASGRWPRRRRLAYSLLIVSVAAVTAFLAKPWDQALLRRTYPALVDAIDTPYARVVMSRTDAQTAVFENGALAFDTEGTSAEAFADLAAVQHAHPRRALVIGGAAEGVADALSRHGIPVIHGLEVDRRALELVRTQTAAGGSGPAGGRVTVIFEEPRRFLERAGSYDLILVAAGEPASAASSRFYTREFFEQCARRLAPGGVVAIRLAAAENVWPRPLARLTAGIVAALDRTFSSVELVAGTTLYLFASNEPLTADPEVLAGRLAARRVRPRLITAPYLRYLYTNDRRDEVARLIRSTPIAGPNRDGAPVCYQYAALMWLSKFYPDLAAASGGTRGTRWWMLWIAAGAVGAGAAAWLRRGRNRRIAASLVIVGFVGMVLEALLLLRYQIRNGIVYERVGWLLMCFMAGMAAGGYAAGGRDDGAGSRWARRATTIPALVFGIASAAWVAITWLPATSGLAGTSVLLAAAGVAVGASFAIAARLWEGRSPGAASVLYAADVAGGAAGALAATLFLVPAAGLDGSALIATVAAASLAAVIPRPGSGVR